MQETRHWDEGSGRTTPGRSKEDAEDYRYFQDPDLLPLDPPPATVAEIDAALPALPAARRATLISAGGGAITADTAALLVERGQDVLVVAAIARGADPGRTATRVCNDLAVEDWSQLTSEALAGLIDMEVSGRLSATQTKQVLAEMVASGETAGAVTARLGLEALAVDTLESALEQVIAEHPGEWARFCAGEGTDRKKLAGFFTGQVMRTTRGRADGAAVNRLLQSKLE